MAVELTLETTKYELVLVPQTHELVLQTTVVEITLNLVSGFQGIADTVTETGTNAVKSSGIWAWVKGLFTSHKEEENAHDASTIKYNEMTVQGALELMPQPQIQSDWNQSDNILKDYIKNKPAIPTATSELENDSGYITSAAIPTKSSQITVDTPFTPSNAVVAAGDTGLVALQKLQGQYSASNPKGNRFVGAYVDNAINASPLTTFTLVDRRIYVVPFIKDWGFNCLEMILEITTGGGAGSIMKYIIYDSVLGVPKNRLYLSTSKDITATGNAVDSIINFNFQKNTNYWIGLWTSGSGTIRGITAAGVDPINTRETTGTSSFTNSYYALLGIGDEPPAIFPAFSPAGGVIPYFKLKVNSIL